MWVQLVVMMQLDQQGIKRTFRPGDWVDVGRQTAMRWIVDGKAQSPRPIAELIPVGAGIVLLDTTAEIRSQLSTLGVDIIDSATPIVPFPLTLLISGHVDLRLSLFPAGFNLLDKWQCVVPLYSYDVLAQALGNEKERAITQKVIHDLRVPVYDPRLIFARRCNDTTELLDTWQREKRHSANGDSKLAFMRAYYKVKPQLCAVPTTWTDRTAGH